MLLMPELNVECYKSVRLFFGDFPPFNLITEMLNHFFFFFEGFLKTTFQVAVP